MPDMKVELRTDRMRASKDASAQEFARVDVIIGNVRVRFYISPDGEYALDARNTMTSRDYTIAVGNIGWVASTGRTPR